MADSDKPSTAVGDGCLRSVATIIASEARRPADLAARYGSEEFVLLLPDTDAEGCEKIGERIRQALHDLGIAHPMNTPSKLVTISLGGATAWPSAESAAEHASVITTADRALYAAKANGRDRLVMSGEVIAWPGAESA